MTGKASYTAHPPNELCSFEFLYPEESYLSLCSHDWYRQLGNSRTSLGAQEEG